MFNYYWPETPWNWFKRILSNLKTMRPYIKKYGLLYAVNSTYRHVCRKKELNLKKRRTYGNNWAVRRKRFYIELVVRDGGACKKCRTTGIPLTIDHITAIADGGKNHLPNMQLLCDGCHCAKSKDEVLTRNIKIRENGLKNVPPINQ